MGNRLMTLPVSNAEQEVAGSAAVDRVLTIAEAAAELRCSKPHVYNAIRGLVPGTSPLPAISIGRRKLIRRSTLERWKAANERVAGATIPASPRIAA